MDLDDAPPSLEDQKRYWEGIKAREAEEDHKTESQFLHEIRIHREEIERLQRRRDELLAETRAIQVKYELQKDAATILASEFVAEQDAKSRQRDAHRRKMTAWFESRTMISAASKETTRVETESRENRKDTVADSSSSSPLSSYESVNDFEEHGTTTSALTDATPGSLSTVEVFDGEGRLVGSVDSIKSQNAAVLTLLGLPVCRKVRTRPGRHFDQDRFGTIYDPRYTFAAGPDAKPSRWVSVMIQAKGNVRSPGSGCVNCSKGLGPFEGCVVQPSPLFKKCGNCEWSKQPCYMLTEEDGSLPDHSQSVSSGRHSIWSRTRTAQVGASYLEEQDSEIQSQSQEPLREEGPQKLIDAVPRSLSNGVDSLPARESSQDASASNDDDEDDETTLATETLIAPDSLELKHNGLVYTEPTCMRDVPVEKINPTHPYYAESWVKDILTPVKERLEVFRQRLNTHRESGEKTKIFMNNRQVNRGERSIHFIEHGPFHPYQLIAKDYMHDSIVSYDTLFRLAETYHELEGYHSNGSCLVSPGDWIRQRLHELITDFERSNAKGKPFSLTQVIQGLYGDPKLCRLRQMNGKKSVGRPPVGGPKKNGSSKKRKRPVEPSLTAIQVEPPSITTPDGGLPTPSGDEDNARPAKKRKGKKASRDADLRYKGFTDMDEPSGTPIYVIDWALTSVRSRKWASPPTLNQYWHFVQDDDEGCFFEHQGYMGIQERTGEPTWAVYDPPVYFGFLPQDVDEILWAPGTRKVIVRCKDDTHTEEDGQPRGALIAEFRRERPKRRFIVFCQKQNLQTTKTREIEIEHAWESMDPQVVHMVQDQPNIESE